MNVYCLFTAQVGVEAELTEAVAVGSVDYVIPVTDCTRSDGTEDRVCGSVCACNGNRSSIHHAIGYCYELQSGLVAPVRRLVQRV